MAYHTDRKKILNTNKKTQVSCIKGLTPYMCVDTETGEILPESEYKPLIVSLIDYVKNKTTELVNTREEDLISMLDDPKCPSQAVGAMQRYGIVASTDDLDQKVRQKYRINRLIMHKTFTEYKAYHLNEDPKKNPPNFAHKINLGAVDKQMASISFDMEHRVIALQWECWTRDITLMFNIPAYVLDYNVDKFCLPTVQYDPDTGELLFFLPVQESLSYRLNEKSCHAKVIVGGYDLGRVKPFVLTVMTDTGKVIARRQASPRLRELNDKRERILQEKKILVGKIEAYDKLGIHPRKYDVYEENIARLAAKAKALGGEVALLAGAELAGLCEHHGIDVLVGETLNWVNDAHGSSRWVQGKMQESIAHAVRRAHAKHFTVSARNTSRTCPKCSSKNTRYDSRSRVVTCGDCGYSDDRDSVGSENVAARRAKVQLRQRVRELLAERASAGDVLPAGNSRVCWCPGRLAGGWGMAVGRGFGLDQAFLPYGNTALSWSRPSVSDYVADLINNKRTSKL